MDSRISTIFAKATGEVEANKLLTAAEHSANALAAKLLAATECPADLIEWGRRHNIPAFAEITWQAGFAAGMRATFLALPLDTKILQTPTSPGAA